MNARPNLLLLAGLVAGLAASCYTTPATEGLPCEEDEACDEDAGEFCKDGNCRSWCETDYDCAPGQTCPDDACLPCNVDCGDGYCCGEGWICCGGGGCALSAAGCDGGGPDDGGGDGDGGDGDTPEQDPDYPRPDGEGNCPPGMATLSGAPFCAPPCGANQSCPDGATGSATGQCVFNPESSAEDCAETGECTNPDEICQENAGGGMSCLLPSSHCVLFCDVDAQNCPVQMECLPQGFCVYP